MSYKEPLKDVSTWRGFFEPSTATSFIEREWVRVGYETTSAAWYFVRIVSTITIEHHATVCTGDIRIGEIRTGLLVSHNLFLHIIHRIQ